MAQEMEILTSVNGFYQEAFSQLVQYTFAIIALVGILVPLIAGIIQWRSTKTEKESLEKLIRDEIARTKLELQTTAREEIKSLVATENTAIHDRIDQKFNQLDMELKKVEAKAFHLQGNTSLDEKNYSQAARDFCSSTTLYFSGQDELNGKKTLSALIENCLPKIIKSEYENNDMDELVDMLIEVIEQSNANGRYFSEIQCLKTEIRNVKSREAAQA